MNERRAVHVQTIFGSPERERLAKTFSDGIVEKVIERM